MRNLLIKMAVRTRFALTSRNKVSLQIRRSLDAYLALSQQIKREHGAVRVEVPRMPGVDEEMRNWSFFMILEHNAIVNRGITSIIQSLVRGEEPEGAGAIDMKRDVRPSRNPGEAQIQIFRASVEDHLQMIPSLGRLRRGLRTPHPIFGRFDAHNWNCMFGLHLYIHYKQAEYVIRKISAEKGGGAESAQTRTAG
ncbi:hypothetical protein [Desulfosarcina sp.]|uniref:hypothetical protein n=1 Tax=Desulfosarcina sp. TaxID=2027861 RepID=UPI0029AAD438|nr:hypothetical protein [Desulfosarcina sp.]MDX2451354.1 hypothetical protein [Desulfosarcina sp.]MDX2489178.1 hypothetical protein [Desulfosarcina sp.]